MGMGKRRMRPWHCSKNSFHTATARSRREESMVVNILHAAELALRGVTLEGSILITAASYMSEVVVREILNMRCPVEPEIDHQIWSGSRRCTFAVWIRRVANICDAAQGWL